jgi:hypothetical protein
MVSIGDSKSYNLSFSFQQQRGEGEGRTLPSRIFVATGCCLSVATHILSISKSFGI